MRRIGKKTLLGVAALCLAFGSPIRGEEALPQEEAAKTADAPEKPPAVPAHPSNGTGGKPGVFEDQAIRVGDQDRNYRLVVPETLPADRAAPVIFGYHAYRGQVKKWLHEYSGLDALAKEKSLIVVYPLAPISWSFEFPANTDVDFFDVLLKDISTRYNVDLNRIYVAGISNGGTFIQLLASLRSETIAAAVAHSAGLGRVKPAIRLAKRKFPILIVHGGADTVIPVDAGRRERDFYRKLEHPVEYLEFPELPHEWATGHDIDHVIWSFFAAHPLPESKPGPRVSPAPPANP